MFASQQKFCFTLVSALPKIATLQGPPLLVTSCYSYTWFRRSSMAGSLPAGSGEAMLANFLRFQKETKDK
jgi:hypothetical protein